MPDNSCAVSLSLKQANVNIINNEIKVAAFSADTYNKTLKSDSILDGVWLTAVTEISTALTRMAAPIIS
ncbi:hypothetical protein ACFLQV_04315 [Calditrichota bacterium]